MPKSKADEGNSNVLKVQEWLIKTIQEKGIIHVLEWIGSVYKDVAEAELKDYYSGKSKEMAELSALISFVRTGRNITNKSSGVGFNMMGEARLQALATMLDKSQLTHELNKTREEMLQSSASKTPG